jgi:hypothetical protein
LLNVRYVVASKDVTLDWDKFSLAYDGDPQFNVYRNERALPRAFVVTDTRVAASHAAAWDAIHEEGFDPAREAVVEGSDAIAGGQGDVRELRIAGGSVTARVVTGGPALLFISQAWYPGWQVWINGERQGAPLRANYAFTGVPLGTGEQLVELRFRPLLWRLGWLVAAVGTLALLAWACVGRVRRQQAGRQEAIDPRPARQEV